MPKTPSILRRASESRAWWAVAALALVLLLNLFLTDGFWRIELRDGRLYGSLIDIVDRAAPVMLLALGMTMVIATAGVDLSVGAVMAIAGAIAAGLIAQPDSVLSNLGLGGSFALAIAIALAVAAVAGLGNGLLVAGAGVQPIVATLILMVAGRGIAQLLTRGQIVTVNNEAFTFLGNGFVLGLPISFTIVLGALLVTGLVARRTALGLYVEALGTNPVASHYAGVNTRLVKLLVYTLCGFLAGVAGIIVAADIKAADANNAGLYLELDAILAVVIGGTALTGGRFSLIGALAGALLIQSVTTTMLGRGVASEHTLVVKALVIVAVCLLQSRRFRQGLLPRKRRAAP